MSNDYVGVPNGYQVQQGSRWDVSQINNPSSSSYGRVGTRPIMGAPTYRPADLDSLFGKGPQQVGNTQKLLYALGYLKSFVPGTYDDNTRSALGNDIGEFLKHQRGTVQIDLEDCVR